VTSRTAPIQSSFTIEPNTFPLEETTTCLYSSSSDSSSPLPPSPVASPLLTSSSDVPFLPHHHHPSSFSSTTTTTSSPTSFAHYPTPPRRPPRPNPFDIAPIFSTQWLPFAYRSTGTLVEVKSTAQGELLVFNVSKLGEAFPKPPSVFYKGGAFPQGVLSCGSEDILVSVGVKPLEGGVSSLRVRIHDVAEGGGGGGGRGGVRGGMMMDCRDFDLMLGENEGGVEMCLAPCLRSGSFIHFRDNIVCVERFR